MSSYIAQSVETGSKTDQPVSQLRPSYLFAAILCFLSLFVYLLLIGRWSLDADEIYTLRGSTLPVSEILSQNAKPVYYLMCHYAVQLPLPLEYSLRLPAAVAGSLIAPVFYLLLWRPSRHNTAFYAALLLVVNPWLIQQSLYGRYYTLVFLLAAVSALSLYRWLSDRRWWWILIYGFSALFATLSHTAAAVLFPAGVIAICTVLVLEDQQKYVRIVTKHGFVFIVGGLGLIGIAACYLSNTFLDWFGMRHGSSGNYTVFELLVAICIWSGLQVWALAWLPLAKMPRYWNRNDVFLVTFFLVAFVPLVLLTPFGGGVAAHYLLQALPCLYVLAAQHWDAIARGASQPQYRFALGAALLTFYFPYGVSTLLDGNHADYRSAAKFVDELGLEDPIIAATAHGMFMHYSSKYEMVHELSHMDRMNGGNVDDKSYSSRTMLKLIREAELSGRPLILVALRDRKPLDATARKWVSDRFVEIQTIETPRLDHRRNSLVIYEYRPARNTRLASTKK